LIARGYPDGTCSTNDTDRVHGAQQLSLFNAHYDSLAALAEKALSS
jgi:hypothetical protein